MRLLLLMTTIAFAALQSAEAAAQAQTGAIRVVVRVPGTSEVVPGVQITLTGPPAPPTLTRSLPPPPSPPPPPLPPPGTLNVGGGVSQPRLLKNVSPQYSDEARNARAQGSVELMIVVKEDGSVEVRNVTKPLGYGLDQKAIDAVKQWQFAPAQKDGKPVPVYVSVMVNFSLGGGGLASGSAQPLPGSTTAITDANGVAVFSNLAPGRYNIMARRDGYIGVSSAGSTSAIAPISDTASAEIGSQPAHEVSLFLEPEATVSGHLRDAGGLPIAGTRVWAAFLGYMNGRRTLLQGPATQVDSRGEYRLTRLGPGDYYIGADFAPLSASRGKTYYPGVSDPAAAMTISIRGGEEVAGINFDLNAKTYKVSGKFVNLPVQSLAARPPEQSIPSFTVLPRDSNDIDVVGPMTFPNQSGTNGEFEIAGIPPGSWDLVPTISVGTTAAAGSDASRYALGRVPIEVVDRDVQGVTISLGVIDLKGRVTVSGASQLSLPPFSLSLAPRDNMPKAYLGHLRSLQSSDSNGEFVFLGVPSGKYSFELQPTQLQGHYIADIRVGSKSIYTDGIISVGSEPLEPIEIIVSRGGESIEGAVQGIPPEASPLELAAIRVVLVPSQAWRKNKLLYKTALLGGDRLFKFFDVPLGEYKVFAWKNLPPSGAEHNDEFVAKYEEFGTPVTVAAGPIQNVQVKLIP